VWRDFVTKKSLKPGRHFAKKMGKQVRWSAVGVWKRKARLGVKRSRDSDQLWWPFGHRRGNIHHCADIAGADDREENPKKKNARDEIEYRKGKSKRGPARTTQREKLAGDF